MYILSILASLLILPVAILATPIPKDLDLLDQALRPLPARDLDIAGKVDVDTAGSITSDTSILIGNARDEGTFRLVSENFDVFGVTQQTGYINTDFLNILDAIKANFAPTRAISSRDLQVVKKRETDTDLLEFQANPFEETSSISANIPTISAGVDVGLDERQIEIVDSIPIIEKEKGVVGVSFNVDVNAQRDLAATTALDSRDLRDNLKRDGDGGILRRQAINATEELDVAGVDIKSVEVDDLQTYFEEFDVDLLNALDDAEGLPSER